MEKPWSAEIRISEKDAKELIEHQFPELAPVQLSLIGEGWDNLAFRVNQCYVFRFPRRKVAVELIETEKRILPSIASLLPLKIPVPQFLGEPDTRFQWPFVGYSFLKGQTACVASLTLSQRIQAAAPIAQFLKKMHQIPQETLLRLSPPLDQIGRLDLSLRIPQLKERLNWLLEQGLLNSAAPYLDFIESFPLERGFYQKVLAHGDLYVRHLIVNEKGIPVGIIDWGDVHYGDPALDLSICYSLFPKEGQVIFQEIYGKIAENASLTWQFAKFKALYYGIVLLAYGADIKDSDLLREGKNILEFALENENGSGK